MITGSSLGAAAVRRGALDNSARCPAAGRRALRRGAAVKTPDISPSHPANLWFHELMPWLAEMLRWPDTPAELAGFRAIIH
jgi:hypothetical protein